MADFLEDYSNLNAAGSAFEGFAQSWERAEDRRFKRQEHEAQIQALKTKQEREALEFEMKKQENSPEAKAREDIMKLAPSGQEPVYDDASKLTGTRYKPEYIKMNQLKADATAARHGQTAASGLRDDWMKDPVTRATKEVSAGYNNMISASKNPSPAGDMSMIFSYMKMLDPNSTVREGEYANAQNAASIPDQVRNAYNKAKEGTILNAKQRSDFINQGKSLYETRLAAQKKLNSAFSGVASRSKVDPRDVVLEDIFEAPASGLVTAPGGLLKTGLVGGAPMSGPDLAAKKKRLEELRAKAAGG